MNDVDDEPLQSNGNAHRCYGGPFPGSVYDPAYYICDSCDKDIRSMPPAQRVRPMSPAQRKGIKLESVTIGVGRPCPTCHELPTAFRPEFERRVENHWIVPAKSEHLSGDGKDGVVAYTPSKDAMSPPGLYTAVIVPMHYHGEMLEIRRKPTGEGIKRKKKGAK